MALTATQKAQIRTYLGYGDTHRDLNTALESQLDTLSAEAETIVTTTLTRLTTNDAKLETAVTENLDLAEADEAKFLGVEQLRTTRAHGRTLIQRIAIVFNVVPAFDYYDEGGAISMGGVIPLG